MQAFKFTTPPDITLGAGKVVELGNIAKDLAINKLFIVTDPGILEHSLLTDVLSSL